MNSDKTEHEVRIRRRGPRGEMYYAECTCFWFGPDHRLGDEYPTRTAEDAALEDLKLHLANPEALEETSQDINLQIQGVLAQVDGFADTGSIRFEISSDLHSRNAKTIVMFIPPTQARALAAHIFAAAESAIADEFYARYARTELGMTASAIEAMLHSRHAHWKLRERREGEING